MKKIISALFICMMLIPAVCMAQETVSVYPCGEETECAVSICLDDEAGCFCLQLNTAARNIVTEEIVMDGDLAYTRVFWTEKALPAGSRIVIRAYQGEVFPRFRVTFLNEKNEVERYYVAESGKDGSLFLTAGSPDFDFIICKGLEEAVSNAEALNSILLDENAGPDEKESAAYALLSVWEDARNAAWGGYAQSYAEQDWMAERDRAAEAMTASREAEDDHTALFYSCAAEYTRLHVLELRGIYPAGEEEAAE